MYIILYFISVLCYNTLSFIIIIGVSLSEPHMHELNRLSHVHVVERTCILYYLWYTCHPHVPLEISQATLN